MSARRSGSGPYGYKSDADFQRAVEREMCEASRGMGGKLPEGYEQPKKVLRGKPGSKERLDYIARTTGVDQALLNSVGRDLNADRLLKTVRSLQRDGFSVERIEEAVALTVELDRGDVAELIYQSLPDDSGDAYESMLMSAVEQRNEKMERDAEAAEKKRLAVREAMFQREYDVAAQHSPEALDAVDAMAQGIGAENLYDEFVDPDRVRATMRATGVMAASQRDTLGQLRAQTALDEAFKTVGAPGSAWADHERALWESELTRTSMEAASKLLISPDAAAEIAVESVMGNATTFMDAFDAEIKNLSTAPEHQERQSQRDAQEHAKEGYR